ncbi:MAG: DUF4190 domain-containing protein [Actinobacteria bacterium]|nr:DUF4190 domain-containing protein [Actinomycetota bacterium]
MTDPYAGQTDGNAADQTIPLVPDAGFSQPDLPPFPEETWVDSAGPSDPWASGPGLGDAAKPEHTLAFPSDPASAAPTAPVPTPASSSWPAPAAPEAPTGVRFGYSSPADYPRTAQAAASGGAAYGVAPTPAPAPPTPPQFQPQPAPQPAPQNTFVQPPFERYPEPNGPAGSITNQLYAATPYAGQAWPGAVDPVAYDYGYSYGYGGQASAPHPNATTSLVMGILGLVLFTPLAPIAWYLAARGKREMRQDPGRWAPSPMLTAGMVMGIIGTSLMAFFLVMLFLVFVLAISS